MAIQRDRRASEIDLKRGHVYEKRARLLSDTLAPLSYQLTHFQRFLKEVALAGEYKRKIELCQVKTLQNKQSENVSLSHEVGLGIVFSGDSANFMCLDQVLQCFPKAHSENHLQFAHVISHVIAYAITHTTCHVQAIWPFLIPSYTSGLKILCFLLILRVFSHKSRPN